MRKKYLLFVGLAFVSAFVLAAVQKVKRYSQPSEIVESQYLQGYLADEVIANYSGNGINGTNLLYITEGLRFSYSKTNLLPVSLQNEDQIVGFQMDVVLPGGLTVAKNSKNKYIININEDRAESHSLSANAIDDYTIRIVGTSMSNDEIYDNDGVLLEMAIDVASWVEKGEYAIQLKNVKLTNINKQTVACTDRAFIVTVGGITGDVNNDEEIDVTDAVLIIDHILLKNPTNFDASLADVNGDGEIDVTDVVLVIDAILGKIELSRNGALDNASEALSAYTAFQMDLNIPKNYVLEDVSLTELAKKSHTIRYNMLPNGSCRVVVCSMTNEPLPGAWNEVISLNLKGEGNAKTPVDHAIFVTIAGERHELILDGIKAVNTTDNTNLNIENCFDLQGRRVEKATKGLYIINGKKAIKK